MPDTIPLAQYLFARLFQLNCRSVHGVPGDFFLRALDYTKPAGIKWIGNANELCAGYAADGYARAGWHAAALANKPKVGALFTTYGVGELSAINAVAGAYAESVPLVHFVGTPARAAWKVRNKSRLIHHTLADTRMEIYSQTAKPFVCGHGDFHTMSAEAAAETYDNLLQHCVQSSRPLYISIPSDMVEEPVPASPLQRPLELQSCPVQADILKEVSTLVLNKLKAAKNPLLIADGLAYSTGLGHQANTLVRLANLPATCFTAGKGVLDEGQPSFQGTLSGPSEISASADLVLMVGPLLSDTNTVGWSALPATENTIYFNQSTVEIDGISHSVSSTAVLDDIVAQMQRESLPSRQRSHAPPRRYLENHEIKSSGKISQDGFWARISSFLEPNDTVLYANGTPLVGSRDMFLPRGGSTQIISSGIWNSIGQMLPAAQGVSLAKRDNQIPGRTILYA